MKDLVQKNREAENSNNILINELDAKVDEVVLYYRETITNEKLKSDEHQCK